MSQHNYNTRKIRELLNASFTAEELRQLCYDEFKPVYQKLAEETGKSRMIFHLIEYCEIQMQFERLLDIVQQKAPGQYAMFANDLIVGGKKPELPSYVSFEPSKKDVTIQVIIKLELRIKEFTSVEQQNFISTIAQIVNLNPNQIRLLKVEQGSVLITVEMPKEAAQLLVSMYLASDPVLQKLGITMVELQQTSTDESDEIKFLQEMISIKTRSLQHLQLQAAKFGISAPPHIVIQIEDLEKEIEALKQKLNVKH